MIEQYDHKTLVEMFDSQNVSPILPYESIDADEATIEASTQASGRISISVDSGIRPTEHASAFDQSAYLCAEQEPVSGDAD